MREGSFRSADAVLSSLTVAHLMDGVQSGEVLEATGLTIGVFPMTHHVECVASLERA